MGRVVLVAPSLHLRLADDPARRVWSDPWRARLATVDAARIRTVAPDIRALFSDNDRVIPLDEASAVARELCGATVQVCHERGHWGDDSQRARVSPEILSALID